MSSLYRCIWFMRINMIDSKILNIPYVISHAPHIKRTYFPCSKKRTIKSQSNHVYNDFFYYKIYPNVPTEWNLSSPFFELKQTLAFSITHYNVVLFVTSILIGWRLYFHGINSTVDAIGETTQAQTQTERFKTSQFSCVFFWIHYNGDNSIVFEALPASVLIWWSQIPIYLLRLLVASKLTLRLSNL